MSISGALGCNTVFTLTNRINISGKEKEEENALEGMRYDGFAGIIMANRALSHVLIR